MQTKEIVERAIYFDFEGRKDHAPAMAGILCESQFEQVVFDPTLAAAAKTWRLRCVPLAEEIRRLHTRCREEQRFLVCYSSHELDAIKAHAGIDVSDVYVNALLYARRWKNRFHPERPIEDWGLKAFLRFIKHPQPQQLAEAQPASWLRYVGDQLATHEGQFGKISAGGKRKWRDLLAYNRHDCTGLRVLLRKIVRARWDPSFAITPTQEAR